MLRRHVVTALLLLGVACASCEPDYSLPPARRPDPRAGPAPQSLRDEAARQVAAMKRTAYDHVIRVDEAAGVFEFDCSGFVDYALENVAPDALDALRGVKGSQRPNARTYVRLIASIPKGETRGRWTHVKDVASLEPGDVIAWLAASKKPDVFGIVNTGHVMIVDGVARERVAGEWVVSIIDSSFGHGGADARRYPASTGLGRGAVVLLVEGGSPTGYRWTEGANSAFVATEVELGRVR